MLAVEVFVLIKGSRCMMGQDIVVGVLRMLALTSILRPARTLLLIKTVTKFSNVIGYRQPDSSTNRTVYDRSKLVTSRPVHTGMFLTR